MNMLFQTTHFQRVEPDCISGLWRLIFNDVARVSPHID